MAHMMASVAVKRFHLVGNGRFCPALLTKLLHPLAIIPPTWRGLAVKMAVRCCQLSLPGILDSLGKQVEHERQTQGK